LDTEQLGSTQTSQRVAILHPGPLQQLRGIYKEYPPQFWMLILGLFVDQLGGALVFPFLTLYITRRFGVGMTEIGLLLGVFAVTNLIGSTLGGALTDRFGRKGTLIFGLVVSALVSLVMGLADSFQLLMVSMAIVGLFANVGGPAAQAMVADLASEEKRAQAFGILRVVHNLAVAIGPAIGGLVAVRSYLILFIADAVTSLITAIFAGAILQETNPSSGSDVQRESIAQTFRGYGQVLRDTRFAAFVLTSMLIAVVAIQMNTSLGVYLRDAYGLSDQRFGYLLTLNASMVVLLQFYITRRMQGGRPLVMAALGSALYALGYTLYGFVAGYALFLTAMAILTLGEMVFVPSAQALAAYMAPEDMRGRYMAAYGLSWSLPLVFGPLASGLIMDNLNPQWLWYVVGLVGFAAAAGYLLLDRWMGSSLPTSRSP
jgi:MFS family permease